MSEPSTARSPNEMDRTIGRLVRARRREIGLSQIKLAEAIGVTFQQVQKYEKGVNRIAASTLASILPVLHLDPQTLFSEASTRAGALAEDSDTIALLRAFHSIRSKQKRKAALDSVLALTGQ